MKVVSYSLFGESNYTERNRFVFDKYLLGAYLNARMNALVYPEWKMCVSIDEKILGKWFYKDYLESIKSLFDIYIGDFKCNNLCGGMLHRMEYVYGKGVHYLLCRDLDALTSHREAMAVNEWIQSGKGFHVIHDNPAHSGLMGGMIGIKTEAFKKTFPEYETFEKLIDGYDLSQHGSDQDLLNKRIAPKIQNDLFKSVYPPSDTRERLWESDLCSSFIGAAGCNEMETLRFFDRFDYDEKYIEFEKKHNNITYWRR